MKTNFMRKLALLLVITVMSTIAVTAQKKEEAKPVLRHVVLFSFKPETTPEQIKSVEQAFAALPSKIKEIKSFEWGLNNSPENKNEGYTHCFFLTFASEADRAVYLPHPAHKAFGDFLGSMLEKVLVIDYWTK